MTWRDWFGMEAKPDVGFEITVPQEMLQGVVGGSIAQRISRREALQVPAVLRARNLIAATLARLPVHIRDKDREIATPTTLLEQIDPDVPNVVTMAQTYEDLLFEAVSWWKVLEVGWHGYPTFAEHVHPSRVHVSGGFTLPVNDSGSYPVGTPMGTVYIDGYPVGDNQVIRFDSPNPPLLVHAARAIRTCLALDQTATNYANTPIPLGYFTPKEGASPREDKNEIEALLDAWEEARSRRVYGYVGKAWTLEKLQFDAEQIQLADQRQHAVLEIARAAGVDPEDLGVSTTSRTYQNAEQRRLDLLDFTLAHYMAAVEERLSMRDVLPRGYRAKVNLDGFLRADTKTRMETYKIGLEVGAYLPNEVRELEDRPDLGPRATAPPVGLRPVNEPMEEAR